MAREGEDRLSMSIRLIPPDEARERFEEMRSSKLVKQRPFSPATAYRYKVYMQQGKWRLNGQALLQSVSGVFIDGQHRFAGCADSGVSVPFVVIGGLDPEIFPSLDAGSVRTPGHTLAAIGRDKARALTGALQWLYRHECGDVTDRSIRLDNFDILKVDHDFPAMRESVDFVSRHGRPGLHSPAPFAFVHFLCMQAAPQRQDFFEEIFSGANLRKDSPGYQFNRWLEHLKRVAPGATITQTLEIMAMAVLAWNWEVTGRRPRKFAWALGGDDPFPEVARPE